MPLCELCGARSGSLVRIEIDGAIFDVCQGCSRLGRRVEVVKEAKRARIHARRGMEEPELVLRPDYNRIIKRARERLGLSQRELGMRIGEKPSVISLLETGRLKPDMILARKLERFLKIELYEPLEGL